MTDENPDLERLYELVRQGEELERQIEAEMTAAAARGVSQRDLADALGASKSTINRRLSSTDVDGSDDLAQRIQGERLKLGQIRVAREASRLQVQRSQAELIAEAKSDDGHRTGRPRDLAAARTRSHAAVIQRRRPDH